MKITEHGYQTKEVKCYPMTIGEMRLSIAESLVKGDLRDVQIRFVDVTMGEVDTYENLEAMLIASFNNYMDVKVYSSKLIHNNIGNYDYVLVTFECPDELDVTDPETEKKDEEQGYNDRNAHYYDKWYRYNRKDDGAAYDRGVLRCVNEQKSKQWLEEDENFRIIECLH